MAERKNQRRICKIDKYLAELTPEGRYLWSEFIEVPRNLVDIIAWWKERGYPLSMAAAATFQKQHEKKGEITILAERLLIRAKGLRPLAAMEASAAIATVIVAQRYKKCEENDWADNDTLLLLNALKEMRSAAIAYNQAQVRRDRTDDVLSGAYELAQKCRNALKDHASETLITEVMNGELKAIEDELRREQLGDL